MKRTRKYIFNTITVVSLLLMLGVVGLWVDSTWQWCSLRLPLVQDWYAQLSSSLDGIGLKVVELDALIKRDKDSLWSAARVKNEGAQWLLGDSMERDWFAFEFARVEIPRSIIYSISFPHWFLTTIFAILPAIWLFKWNKRRKLGPNACPDCGYDLTGNTTGTCPECGKSIGTETAQT